MTEQTAVDVVCKRLDPELQRRSNAAHDMAVKVKRQQGGVDAGP